MAEIQYGIMWEGSAPKGGSVTPMSSREMAVRYAAVARILPGGIDGHVVSRRVTYSEWEAD